MHTSINIASKHGRLISAVIMFLCWLPIIIANFPGSVPFDGMTQLLEHFGRIPHYGHHPVFITRLYGFIVQLGAAIHSENFGVFLVVVFQVIFCAIVFSGVCKYILDIGCPKWTYWVLTFFYGLFPVFGSYVSSVLKDTFYMASVTWFSLELAKLVVGFRTNEQYILKTSSLIKLGASSLLMCLSRKEAKILVALTMIYVTLVLIRHFGRNNKNIKPVLIVLVLVLIINGAFNFFVHNIMGVPKGEIAEALSIPFQQTARYVSEYSDEVTDEEKAAIDLVLPYDKIAESYDPELSDPIKGKMKSGVSKREYLIYAKTWLSMGLKKPLVYIAATWNNIYGYFDPFYKGRSVIQYDIDHSQTARWNTEELDIYFVFEDSDYRVFVIDVLNKSRDIPVLSMLYNPGFYFWIITALMIYCIVKRKTLESILLTVPVLTYLVCFASPANGYGRYILAVYATIWMSALVIIKLESGASNVKGL